MSYPFEDLLIGHVNPLPRYPTRVFPVFFRKMKPYTALDAGEVGLGLSKVVQLESEEVVWHNFDATVVFWRGVSAFDPVSHRVYAHDERRLVVYRFEEEASLFLTILRSKFLKPTDPFVALALAKATRDEEEVFGFLGACLALLGANDELRARWYDQQRLSVYEESGIALPDLKLALTKFTPARRDRLALYLDMTEWTPPSGLESSFLDLILSSGPEVGLSVVRYDDHFRTAESLNSTATLLGLPFGSPGATTRTEYEKVKAKFKDGEKVRLVFGFDTDSLSVYERDVLDEALDDHTANLLDEVLAAQQQPHLLSLVALLAKDQRRQPKS